MVHMRIHDFVVCEEQRGRPVSAYMQSDQHLCFLLYIVWKVKESIFQYST